MLHALTFVTLLLERNCCPHFTAKKKLKRMREVKVVGSGGGFLAGNGVYEPLR